MPEFKIESLFPKTIMTSNIERTLSKKETNFVNYHSNHIYENQGNVTSLERNILDKDLPKIKNFILDGINQYADKVFMPENNLKFYITQSWLNYTKPGQYHHKHNHANSIISGVFYINADPAVDKILFFDDFNSQIKIEPKEWNWYNSSSWFFRVKTGDLILFPSKLDHAVETTVGKDVRISLSFNVFVKGLLGSETALTALHL